MAEFLVDVKPEAEWRKGLTKPKLRSELDAEIGKIPGLEIGFSQPIRDNVLESISQIDGQIVIKVFGEDADTLRQKAADVLRTVASIRGVARAFIDRAGEVPQLQIEVDRARAARHGLNVADVEDVIETALGGKVATQMWEGDRRFGVAVRLRPQDRTDVEAIRNVLVDTPAGPRVPLADLARIGVKGGSMTISPEQ